MTKRMRFLTAGFGLASVSIFAITFFLFAILNPDFDVASDYISKLGSKGQPYSHFWNVVGFGLVGIVLATFGWFFGMCAKDRVLGACLMVSGIGFAMAAIPADFADAHSPLTKAHYASICIALAGWCFGLARLSGSKSTDGFSQTTANYTVVLALLPMLGIGVGISAEPVSHRLVLVVVFGWIVLNSIRLLKSNAAPEFAQEK